jgi:hypothetical protein
MTSVSRLSATDRIRTQKAQEAQKSWLDSFVPSVLFVF